MKSYIRYVREVLKPQMTEEAEQVLTKYYQRQRRTAQDNAGLLNRLNFAAALYSVF